MTEVPADAHPLPSDAVDIATTVQHLFVHTAWRALYGLGPDASDDRQRRSAAEMIDAIRALDPRPLTEPREPAQRAGVVCRHFTTLSVAMLRDAGVAARARCGFATYFEREKYVDHWVVEWHDGTRWIRTDTQLDQLQREALGTAFDPVDVPADQFRPAGEIWRGVRAGEIDPDTCGIFEFWGAWFVRANVVRDLAALNKVEMLPWDTWGAMEKGSDRLIDDIAALAGSDDLDAIRERYRTDKHVRVPGRVRSYTPAGPRDEAVPV
jgi:hypothetical protein